VYIESGTFRLVTGTIYGNESTVTAELRNTATNANSAALQKNAAGTATYGPAPAGTGNDLVSIDNTIRVVNGVLQ